MSVLVTQATAPTTVWHHVVLHLRSQADKTRRSKMLGSLLGSLKRKYKDSHYVWAWHQTMEEVHCHMLVGSATEIDAVWLRNRWARIMQKYGENEYKPRDCFCKPRHFSLAVLSYILGVNKNHPRNSRPWGWLAGKVTDHNFPRRKRFQSSHAVPAEPAGVA
jgi:hypothetical protein